MDYEFKQIPPNSTKKELFLIGLLSIVFILLIGIVVFIGEQQKWQGWIEIVICALIFVIISTIGFTLFAKRNQITKQIKLQANHIVIKEIHRTIGHQQNDNTQNTKEYLITPDMILCYRYVDGSETASRFEICTHNDNLKIVIPDSLFTNQVKYNTFISKLTNWLKTYNVPNCAHIKK